MEIRDRFIKKWNECDAEVKWMVYDEFSQQSIHYILTHENYKKESTLRSLIETTDYFLEQYKRIVARRVNKTKKI